MAALTMPSFSNEEIKIEPRLKEATLELLVDGSSTSYTPDDLQSYLQELHTECIRLGVSQVVVDLRNLEFMNSAGFSTFIDWLMALQDADKAKQYKVRYISNDEHTWQKRGLQALRCIADDLVSIET
jgi:hypothetical protein